MSRDARSLSAQYSPGVEDGDDDVYLTIDTEARAHGMSDMDVWCAWRLGLAAYQELRKLDGRLLHDPSGA